MTDPPHDETGALAGRYVLRREVGSGGMATVYLADDLKQRRQVAVKVLKSELSAALGPDRFLREIEVVAQLSHPHIIPLFDSGDADGVLYYVMPFVDGESLRACLRRQKQLAFDEALRIIANIASALDYAHRRGFIHRDIKPENILLHDHEAQLTDFGIALAITVAAGDRLTAAGLAVGTPEYMSPEQVVGETGLDARSDIYSLACVLYEMLAGQPPFTGATAQAVIARQIAEVPPPLSIVRPSVSREFAQAVAKALSKAPADRFDTSTAFVSALTDPASSRDSEHSVAVLPLKNLSGDIEQEYFADGMTEALIAELGRIAALKVISRTSAMRYKGSLKTLPEIAHELGVNTIVEGSILRAGDRLRVTAQLVDASTDTHLWADSYERTVTDVLTLQRELAYAIVKQISVKIAPQEEMRLLEKAPINTTAHDAYLRGRYHLNHATPVELAKAIHYFELATREEPRYALAFAGLANAYNYLGWLGGVAADVFPKAKKAALRALEIDDSLAEAHAILGYTATFYDWDWITAKEELKRALALNPNYAEGYLHYSWYLASQGQLDEARAAITRASDLDPLSLVIQANMTNYFQFKRDYDAAQAQAQRTLELAPDLPLALLFSGLAYCGKHEYGEAVAQFRQLVDDAGPGFKGYLGYACAKAQRTEDALAILVELERLEAAGAVPSFQIGLVFLGLDRIEEALTWIEKAFAERAGPWFPYLRQEALFDPLRGHPRFQRLIEQLNFVS